MLFLDSSDPAEIRDIAAWGVVAGITTNPLILAREGATDLVARIIEVLGASEAPARPRGGGPLPVSVELLSESEGQMLDEAASYVALDPARIIIKVPFSESGLRVTARLAASGARANVTACMSFNQAYLAALAGARYVSIFSGRVRDMGYDVRPVIADTREQLERDALDSEIIVGSVRHMMDVNEALAAGAHVVTVPPPILRRMLHNPKTDETIREFNDAWAARRGGERSGGER